MKKNYSKLLLLLIILVSNSVIYAQTNRVKINVTWPDTAHENKVEVYDPANNLILTICNTNGPEDCYSATGSTEFVATYDLGCLAKDPAVGNYHLKLFDINDDGWSSGSSLVVEVEGVADQDIDISSADSSGGTDQIFNVNSDTFCSFIDTDQDGIIDFVDVDDDNDGIIDTAEGLTLDQFNCEVPQLVFLNGVYESGTGSGPGTLNAVYRFDNAIEGYDVLLEIVELDNTIIEDIDDDTVDTAEFLQSRLTFTGNGTPGVTYKFTIVDDETDDPAMSIFRIGGTTWDCDGTEAYQESVRYYNPSAYGLDNPTSLTQDIYPDGAGITAGEVTYDGFSTNTILRSYFQFLSNTFTIRMQLKKTTSTTRTRLYAMSFTQCDIFEYKAPILTIISGVDSDGDGINNELDLDADGDGIPDNVEFQPTLGYVAPSGTIDFATGLDTAYSSASSIVDTDGDDIPDFLDTDSDGDGIPDIDENGIDYSLLNIGTDTDTDGIDDEFEGSELNDPLDVNDEIDNPSTDLPDADGDLGTFGGDVDYRDASNFGSATIDFDGIDDYLDSAQILDGKSSASIMAWIKLADDDFEEDRYVIGQDNFNISVNDDFELTVSINGSSYSLSSELAFDIWVHVAAVYDQSTGLVIYVNGERESSISISGALNTNGDKFTIGKNSLTDSDYFKGSMDEVRVFDVALTDDQLQQMVFQEIEENTSDNLVKGSVVPRKIEDFTLSTFVPWSNLQAYYSMNIILGGVTFDSSSYGRDATLYNINSIQEQTSPIPYETKQDGYWGNIATWLNGDVWDIEDPSTVKDWAIFSIKHNVNYDSSIKSFGLLIEEGKTISLNGDQQLQNGGYLGLDGTIDLADDSQLVQSKNSILVTGTNGKLLRRQEGNLNYYWYNYWSSPVNGIGTETSYKLQNIKDDGGINGFSFTDAYQAENQISRSWLYTFQNGQTYFNWVQITELSDIPAGVGYTQKGTNAPPGENEPTTRQYTFEGKPNNGTILVPAEDVSDVFEAENGGESVQDVTFTSSLVGNPYPSALDAKKFIQDNKPGTGNGVTNGTIYLWEQWSGASHFLNEYEGGYGTINETTEVPAYQWNDPNSGPDPLAKTPSAFISVAQGFFVEVIAETGNLEFNNTQRVFKKESEPDGPIFFRNANSEAETSSSDNSIGLIRLQLNVSNGNSRIFVLAFSENTTDEYDYGFDARTIDPQEDDMNSFIDEEKMVIQTFAPITLDKVVDLVFNSTGTFNYSLEILEIENIPLDQPIIVKDHLTNSEFDLRTGAYNFTSDFSGEDKDRFDIVFTATTLDTEEFGSGDALIFVNNDEDKLYVKGLSPQENNLRITNMLGQTLKNYVDVSSETLNNGLDISNLSSGIYIISLTNDSDQTLDKKVIIE